jgi:hypothetical protein
MGAAIATTDGGSPDRHGLKNKLESPDPLLLPDSRLAVAWTAIARRDVGQ